MNNYINDIKSIIENLDEEINSENLNKIYEYIYENLLFIIPDINKELVYNTLNKLLIPNYDIDYDRKINLINLNEIKIPKKYQKIVNHVKKLSKIPQMEQRSEEWFKLRENMITASSAAQALDENPYRGQKSDDLVREKIYGRAFIDNKFVHHGKKFEEVATKIYENVYNVVVDEYGLIPHINGIDFLGASPDGIVSHKTLDNEFSERVGYMLEIKCPFSRKIKTSGKIDGGICPHYYWCQVQMQLECCDLEFCDFWQCNIQQYDTREEWLNDECLDVINTEEEDKEKYIKDTCKKGLIIQLQPKESIFDEFKSVYIYPKDIDMTCVEYDKWLLNEISNLHNNEEHVFNKVIYWKIKNSHNVIIKRDEEWFKINYEKFKAVWDKIVEGRKNKKPLIKKNNNISFIDSSDDE